MNLKKMTIATVLTLSMLISATGCDSIIPGSKSSQQVKEETETFIDVLQSVSPKKMRYYISDDDLIDEIELISDNDEVKDFVTAILKTVEFKINDNSIKTSKDSASVKVTYTYVDISEADFDDLDELLDYIDDCIDDEDVENGKFTLEFDIDDGEYFVVNGDEIVEDIFDEVLGDLFSNYSELKTNLENVSTGSNDGITFRDCTGYMEGNVYYNEHFNVAVDYDNLTIMNSDEGADDYITDSTALDPDSGFVALTMVGVFEDLEPGMSLDEQTVAMNLLDAEVDMVNIRGLEFVHAVQRDYDSYFTNEAYCLIDGKIVFALYFTYDNDEGKELADSLISRVGLAKYPER